MRAQFFASHAHSQRVHSAAPRIRLLTKARTVTIARLITHYLSALFQPSIKTINIIVPFAGQDLSADSFPKAVWNLILIYT